MVRQLGKTAMSTVPSKFDWLNVCFFQATCPVAKGDTFLPESPVFPVANGPGDAVPGALGPKGDAVEVTAKGEAAEGLAAAGAAGAAETVEAAAKGEADEAPEAAKGEAIGCAVPKGEVFWALVSALPLALI